MAQFDPDRPHWEHVPASFTREGERLDMAELNAAIEALERDLADLADAERSVIAVRARLGRLVITRPALLWCWLTAAWQCARGRYELEQRRDDLERRIDTARRYWSINRAYVRQ